MSCSDIHFEDVGSVQDGNVVPMKVIIAKAIVAAWDGERCVYIKAISEETKVDLVAMGLEVKDTVSAPRWKVSWN